MIYERMEESNPPLLPVASFLRDRWEIIKKIGGGGFGEIYKAKDHNTGQLCAVKVESCISPKQVLKMEVAVLKRLQDATAHVCEFIGCGRNDKVNYVIMTLLGPSLSELRKRQHHQRFSHSTVLRVGIQIITALHSIHNCGFLHRDIKPSNFAIGATPETSRTCFMLDFGLSRQYTTLTGEVRQPRAVAGFRGTVRYASLNAHLAHDLGRHDDLWSVFYMLVELAVGQLPWRRIKDKEEAGEVKAQYDHRKLIKTMPFEFYTFLNHLKDMTYFQKPDYAMLINMLQSSMKRLGIHDSDPYDWEQDYSAPSLTTASAGSPPAVKIIEQNQLIMEGVDGKKEAPTSKTNCSEVADLSENGQNIRPVLISPAPIDQNPNASANIDIKGSPVKSTPREGRNSISNDKESRDNQIQDQPDEEKITLQTKVGSPAQQSKSEGAEKEDDGIGLSAKLEIENRYVSEGETSYTDPSTESMKEKEETPAMEVAPLNDKYQSPQPNIPLPLLMDGAGADFEPLHRYGSITPMKSIHTDSLNRFFDMGPHQNFIGSSETIGNRYPHSQSREQELSQTTTSSSTSYSSCQENNPVNIEIHPESGHPPKQGYTNQSTVQRVDEADKINQPAAPVINMVNDHAINTAAMDDEEVELQSPRVVRLTNGLHDSDSSRSVQIVAATITAKEAADTQESPNEQVNHPDAPLTPPDVNSDNRQETQIVTKQTDLTTSTQLQASSNNNLPALSNKPPTGHGGVGRKLPAIPGSSNTALTLTTKAASLLQGSSPPSNPPTTHRSLNEDTNKQDKPVLPPSSPLIPRPPPNPPPANYTANVLARRRRFIRSQLK